MENKIHYAFNDEWKHHWVSYLNAFDERININETHLKHLQVYEQIGCDEHNTNLYIKITNGNTTVSGDLIHIDDGNDYCDMIAHYIQKWNNKCDKIIIHFYHSCYDIYESGYGFSLEIGFDDMLDCNEPYFAYCYKWLLLLMIYDNYWENVDTMPTHIEKILYDDYLLKKLIQF
jgi:hypothetical protein